MHWIEVVVVMLIIGAEENKMEVERCRGLVCFDVVKQVIRCHLSIVYRCGSEIQHQSLKDIMATQSSREDQGAD